VVETGDMEGACLGRGGVRTEGVDRRRVGVDEIDPARYCGPICGGISKAAHAIVALKRSTPPSSVNAIRTRWLGRRIVGEITCAPHVDRSSSVAGLPSTRTSSLRAI
jgi:hypothetical protein